MREQDEYFLDKLPDSVVFGSTTGKNIFESLFPKQSLHAYYWALTRLLKTGKLEKTGLGLYLKGEERPVFRYSYSSAFLRKVTSLVKKAFPKIRFISYESTILNQFLNLMLGSDVLFLQVEPVAVPFVFDLLKTKTDYSVLLDPTDKEITHYLRKETIIVTPIYSRAPVAKNSSEILLEKLAVDLFYDSTLQHFVPSSEVETIFRNMLEKYRVDGSLLLAYAKRRGGNGPIQSLIQDLYDDIKKGPEGVKQRKFRD
jgi:hypothetical protein